MAELTNILHCDLDAFFASVEQLDNPSLRGKPVVVGGSIHSRGVVSTCSYEARNFGGLRIITESEALELLRPLPVSRIWGIGQKTERRLDKLGIKTIGDIQDLPPEWLEDKIGSAGRLFWELAHGIDKRAVEPEYERKSLGREETFPEDINDTAYLEKLIAQFAAELCRKLRQEALFAATITIKLRYSNFKAITRSKTINPCNSDIIVTQIASELLHHSYNNKHPLRLFGLSLGQLSSVTSLEQGILFEPQLNADYKNIDRLMDEIRDRFGPGAIKRANLLPHKDIE